MVITNSGPRGGRTPGTTKKWWWPECLRACAQKEVTYKCPSWKENTAIWNRMRRGSTLGTPCLVAETQ